MRHPRITNGETMLTTDDADTRARTRRTNWVVGLATLGTAVAGSVAFLVAVVATLTGQMQAAGVCFIAAAIAFGLLANAVLRA